MARYWKTKAVSECYKITLRKIGVVIAVFLCVSIAGLADLSPDNVKLTPSGISVQSSPNLPPEVQAVEAQTAPHLFDRDTTTEHTAYDSSQISAVLETPSEIRGIKLYGAAPYSLSVQAEINGAWQAVSGLQNLNLTTRPDSWNSFQASTPVTTGKLRFALTAASGGSAAGLKGIEVWGKGGRVNVKNGAALLAALLGTSPPSHARLFKSALPQGVIGATSGATDDPSDNSFSITLDRKPLDFKRVYLSYQVLGLSSWVHALRSINGAPVQGGFLLPPQASWSTQIEEINPQWLAQGGNTIAFSAPAGSTGTFTVKDVFLIAELESGANFVSGVADNQEDPTNPPATVLDGDLTTGWTPYPGGSAVKADIPALTLNFDKRTQIEGVALYLVNNLKGNVDIQFLKDGVWSVSGFASVNAAKLVTGWNNLTAPSSSGIDGVRLVFSGGKGSSAEIKEVMPSGSGVGPAFNPPKAAVTFPDAGQFYGRTAYIRGFLQPLDNGSGAAQLSVGGQPVPTSDGAFGVSIGKDDMGLTTQGDGEAWTVEVKAVYPNAQTITTTVTLNNWQPAVESTADNLLPAYNLAVSPGQAKKISHDAATLDIPADALAFDATIGISPLKEEDLPALDTGMTNVTKGPRKGYRFTPHPMKFKSKVKVTLPYSQALVPAGLTEQDVKTFYFDEQSGSWKVLERVAIDLQANTVTSLTDHFTDMINATVTVPDHPQTANFNPTQIKDIKAADPGAQVNLIEVPRANNTGDARLSYPVEVPPGRQGMQPQLAVQYNSAGGNGWMGMGWDVPMQAITIDTRWGVPRYDAGLETETYTLSGEQLTPVAHRGDLVARTPEKIFHTRVEGQFRRIIRHGSLPSDYTWEVTDKNGVKYLYGATDPATETLKDGAGNIFLWALCEIRDPNGNFVKYKYARVNDPGIVGGSVPGSNIYLQTITYTGSGVTEGPYAITLTRDRELSEPRRTDVQIDARGGSKRVTADLLRKVDVTLNSQLIRRYEFKYNERPYGDDRVGTAFNKTLLTSITQFGTDGAPFNQHTFTYNDEIRDPGGNYLGFTAAQDWSVPSDNISGHLIGGNDRASALGGSETLGVGGHLYVGFNIFEGDKMFSFGAKAGYQRSSNKGRLQLIDINGDGLPDKVFEDGGVKFRPNLFHQNGQTAFADGNPRPAVNLSDLSREETESTTFGPEAYFGANVHTSRIDTFSTGSKYISDVNGDGLPDLVTNGSVLFNAAKPNGEVVFTPNSLETPYPVGPGAVDSADLLDNFTDIFEARIDQFPLMDSVRRWVAPFAGQIRVAAPVNLVQDTSPERAEYQTADGVRVAIQLEGSEIWSIEIGPTDYAVKNPTGVSSLTVQKGDRLYFRVQSRFDGAFDQVAWDPVIEYLSVTPTTDVNQLDVYRYQASTDFVMTGRPSGVRVPLNGVVKVGGVLTKLGTTTDNIEAQIFKNGVLHASRSLAANQTGTIDFSDLSIPVSKPSGAGDQLSLRVRVDSPIDARQIDWTPEIFYISSPDAPVTDQNGNFQIKIVSPYDMDLYPRDNLTAPQQAWTVTQTGTATVVPSITLSPGTTPSTGEIILTVKKQGALVAKYTLTVDGDTFTPPSVSVDVTQNDRLYFDLNVRDPGLYDRIQSASINVTFGDPNTDPGVTVPSAVHGNDFSGAFPVRYRGWAAVAYNGNRERATQPIDQASLVVDQNFTMENARAYPLAPIPSENRWRGQDDNNWVAAGTMSSSRLGIDFIQVPQAGGFAGGSGVSRLGRSKETSVGLGVSFLSGSRTIDHPSSSSELDFIDLNGDRFPDVVSNRRVQYSPMVGGLEGNNREVPGWGGIRRNETLGESLGIGGNPASNKGDSKGTNDPSGGGGSASAQVKVFIVKSDMPSIGLSANVSRGTSTPQFDLMDVNGDGLPDRVIQSGGNLSVQLNLGYKFADPEPWGAGVISDGESKGLAGSLGYNDSIYGWAGGVNLGRNDAHTKATLVDINGDGLLDRVRPAGGALSVGFNTGNGFAPDVAWQGAIKDEINTNTSDTQGAGAYFTIGIGPLCYPTALCYIIINPGVNGSLGMGRQEVSILDIDGDGYPDHLFSEKDNELRVASNRTGRTNLLKKVHRPLGATFDLEYTRDGNTFDLPQSRWLMTKVTVFDGHLGEGADRQVTTYGYSAPKYNRLEREFYGYGTVIERHLDTQNANALFRSIQREYLTSSYYTKGLLQRELTADAAARLFLETENNYVLRDVDTGTEPADASSTTATVFPQLTRTDRRFYEGGTVAQKATATLHEYDTLGNVKRFADTGDVGAADDVLAVIDYTASDPACVSTYIVGQATRIVVNGNGAPMRNREATINCATGDVTQVRQFLETGQAAVTDLTYFPDGNLQSVTGPANKNGQRYRLDYLYDPTVATHVSRITDSFELFSTADYDPRFGKPTTTTDINGKKTTYAYDTVGRVDTIVGPYEQATDQITIDFDYAAVQTATSDSEGNTIPLTQAPFAFTKHIDKDANGAFPPSGTIDTILFTDGLKRVIQTKKDLALHAGSDSAPADAMTVSGQAAFDAFGRTVIQRYPTTEPKGANTLFNPSFDTVAPTTMAYDVLDRNTKTTIPDGAFTTIAYGFGADRLGLTQFETTVTDANGKQKQTHRDVRELITSVKEFNQGSILWTSYSYDPLKQFVKVVDDKNNITTVAYDNLGRRTVIDNPDTGKTETQYDLASNVIAKVTANLRSSNQQITYKYDFNRLVSIEYPNFVGNNITYTYGASSAAGDPNGNRAGRIARVSSQMGSEERFYGPLGEVVKEIKTINSFTTPNAPEVYTTLYQYDTWNRLMRMTYPDLEVLTYAYDSAGLVNFAQGVKNGYTYDYLKRLEYDKFEQRIFSEVGNNVRTRYAYDERNRRLCALTSAKGMGVTPSCVASLSGTLPVQNGIQNLLYVYDNVGNIKELANSIPVPPASQFGGPTKQSFVYDDLYRLTSASGSFSFNPSKIRTYSVDLAYDSIHNITSKNQSDIITQPSGTPIQQKKTSYLFNYAYTSGPGSSRPHAPIHIGNRTFSYDANGNQLGWDNDDNGTRRTIVWDEENRIQSLFDNGHEKTYKYDDKGDRIIKRGPQGETVYVNQYFTIRNKEIGTKHVFAGTTRLVSKLMKQDKPGANPQGKTPVEKDLYFFHPDHLGSSHYITDTQGKLFEHLEYFPFGETWVEESTNTQRTPYLFTGKELDEETGLYYFGARYYDPRTSVWQSADPIVGKYLPTARNRNSILPGQGGVYNTFNLGLYGYAHQNPVRYTDPDGNVVPLVVAACVASNACMVAVAATVVLATNPQAREALGKSMVSAGKAAAEGVSAAGEKIKNLIFNESKEGGTKAGEGSSTQGGAKDAPLVNNPAPSDEWIYGPQNDPQVNPDGSTKPNTWTTPNDFPTAGEATDKLDPFKPVEGRRPVTVPEGVDVQRGKTPGGQGPQRGSGGADETFIPGGLPPGSVGPWQPLP